MSDLPYYAAMLGYDSHDLATGDCDWDTVGDSWLFNDIDMDPYPIKEGDHELDPESYELNLLSSGNPRPKLKNK